MLVLVDLDGTADAAPRELQSLMSALVAAGHQVEVLSGTNAPEVTEAELQEKSDYLTSLGMPPGSCWNRIVVVTDPVDERKAAYAEEHGADILLDNNKRNLKAATKAGVPLCLLPWASRKK